MPRPDKGQGQEAPLPGSASFSPRPSGCLRPPWPPKSQSPRRRRPRRPPRRRRLQLRLPLPLPLSPSPSKRMSLMPPRSRWVWQEGQGRVTDQGQAGLGKGAGAHAGSFCQTSPGFGHQEGWVGGWRAASRTPLAAGGVSFWWFWSLTLPRPSPWISLTSLEDPGAATPTLQPGRSLLVQGGQTRGCKALPRLGHTHPRQVPEPQSWEGLRSEVGRLGYRQEAGLTL